METGDKVFDAAGAAAARASATSRFDCTACGAEILPALSTLGSLTCRRCREELQPQRSRPAHPTQDSAESLAELRREVHRCRRYRRSLTLVGIPLSGADGQRALRSSVRVLDTVWQDGLQFFVLLPETGREAAGAMISRLAQAQPAALDAAKVRIAVFPDDAMTLGSLMAAASVSSQNARPLDGPDMQAHRPSMRRVAPRRKLAAIFRAGSSYDVPAGLTRPRPTDG